MFMTCLDSTAGGLHHATARTACGVIAGNRWDAYLSDTPQGQPINVGDDELLVRGEYYFIVPGQPSQLPTSSTKEASSSSVSIPDPYLYPIVPNFQQWSFPHGRLPEIWQEVEISKPGPVRSGAGGVFARDLSCRMTDYTESCDDAHLCPKTEEDWFVRNAMDLYTLDVNKVGSKGINNLNNLLMLRSDVHRTYDNKRFVFVPKRDNNQPASFVTHVLNPSQELFDLYHNCKLHEIKSAHEYLFARFAWAIFPMLSGFLERGKGRFLLTAKDQDARWFSIERTKKFGQPPSPSSTPKIRKAPRASTTAPEDDLDNGDPPSKRINKDRPSGLNKREDSSISEPCSMPIGPSPTTPPMSSTSTHLQPPASLRSEDPYPLPQTSFVRDLVYYKRLKTEHLERERARSDPEGLWEKELEWLDGMLEAGGAIDASELPRVGRLMGAEFPDEDI
ncbi:MAG: hypothetical protein Q9163_005006 [Psora crenata]